MGKKPPDTNNPKGNPMNTLKISITPPPAPRRGPQTDPITSILASQSTTPEYTLPEEADVKVKWTLSGNTTIIQVEYGIQKATASIEKIGPTKLVITHNADKITAALPKQCAQTDEQTLAGQAAALAILMTTGMSGPRQAQELLNEIIKYTLPDSTGKCRPPPAFPLDLKHHLATQVENVKHAAEELFRMHRILKEQRLIPQVGINIVEAPPPPYHVDPANHVGIPTRIVATREGLAMATPPAPGGSRHLSRALLVYMEYYPDTRAVMNLAYSPQFVERARRKGVRVSSYDRREEPPEVKRREGGTMAWGIRRALEKCVEKPHVIYHRGDWGKEPMINLFAPTARELIGLLKSIL